MVFFKNQLSISNYLRNCCWKLLVTKLFLRIWILVPNKKYQVMKSKLLFKWLNVWNSLDHLLTHFLQLLHEKFYLYLEKRKANHLSVNSLFQFSHLLALVPKLFLVKPNQLLLMSFISLWPNSLKVGPLGKLGWRALRDTTTGTSLPAVMCGMDEGNWSSMYWMLPPSKSVRAGPMPL